MRFPLLDVIPTWSNYSFIPRNHHPLFVTLSWMMWNFHIAWGLIITFCLLTKGGQVNWPPPAYKNTSFQHSYIFHYLHIGRRWEVAICVPTSWLIDEGVCMLECCTFVLSPRELSCCVFFSYVYLLRSSWYLIVDFAMCIDPLLMFQVLMLLVESLAWSSIVTIEFLTSWYRPLYLMGKERTRIMNFLKWLHRLLQRRLCSYSSPLFYSMLF